MSPIVLVLSIEQTRNLLILINRAQVTGAEARALVELQLLIEGQLAQHNGTEPEVAKEVAAVPNEKGSKA